MAARAARNSSGPVIRSISPSPKFHRRFSAPSPPSNPPPFASTTALTSPRSFQRHASPTRVNLYSYTTPSLGFSVDRSGPNRAISYSRPAGSAPPRRTCMCSPTNHPGSFRCSLHKSAAAENKSRDSSNSRTSSNSLTLRRSAMKNSLVRIGTVEGDLVKRALATLIRPSTHHQRRRGEFRPLPSRLSVMSEC